MEEKKNKQKWPVHYSKDGVWSTGGMGRHMDDAFYAEVEAFDRDDAQAQAEKMMAEDELKPGTWDYWNAVTSKGG
jgi:hypothetical protein